VVGQIQSLDEGSVAGHQVTNCRVVVNPFQQNRPSRTTWYELSIWDSLAHAFGRQGFRVGDMALFRLDNIRVEAWLDREGQPRATIKAGVDKFLDLRPAAPPPAPAEPGRTPSAEGPGPAGAAPRPRAL
jgi:hypothetical protein